MKAVSRETEEKLRLLAELVLSENRVQNLIAKSTEPAMWDRHIVDSLQLAALASGYGTWLDIGSGGGFPGLAVAVVRTHPMVLVEPRSRRADFLRRAAEALDLSHVSVEPVKIEALHPAGASIITARAVASLEQLCRMAARHGGAQSTWLFPKGRRAAEELAAARLSWQGDFTLVPSETDREASVVMIRNLHPRVSSRR